MDFRIFSEWEEVIANQYEILFSRPSPAQVKRVVVDEIPESLNWISFMDKLSNGDITKHELVYQTNYIESLNLMAWWHHRDKYTEQMNRLQNKSR